jgi:predicted protein tyrosine phosphatase
VRYQVSYKARTNSETVVCSRNKRRSLTAEKLLAGFALYQVRSPRRADVRAKLRGMGASILATNPKYSLAVSLCAFAKIIFQVT